MMPGPQGGEFSSISARLPGALFCELAMSRRATEREGRTEPAWKIIYIIYILIYNIYKLKAEGAFIRSRKKWIEEGEQNSSYFFRLEKFHSKNNTIHKLNIDGVITDDQKINR